jgi:hypothetical protein
MLNQIEEAEYVLVVCTERYQRRFHGKDHPGRGKGSKWEGAVITVHLYEAELYNTKFIPVLFELSDEPHIPIVLRATTSYDLSMENGYQELYRRLTNQPEVGIPPIAAGIRPMPPADIVTEQRLAEARDLLKLAQTEFDRNRFDAAAEFCEKAASLAKAVGSTSMECKSLRELVRALGQQAASARLQESERLALVARVHRYINDLEELGESPSSVAVERALISRLEGHPERTIELAELAAALAGSDLYIQADSLIARVQALWQLDRPAEALGLSDEVEDVRSRAEDDPKLALHATWIRTLCKAGNVTQVDLKKFVEEVRSVSMRGNLSRERLAMFINEVEFEFGRAGLLADRLLLCELTYEVLEPTRDVRKLVLVSLEAAEIAAAIGEDRRARLHLQQADTLEKERRQASNHEAEEPEAAFQATVLYSRGRVLTRLADGSNSDSLKEIYLPAYEALTKARDFAVQNRSFLESNGDIDFYLADLSWWLGRTAMNLGRLEEAAETLRSSRSDSALANVRFAAEVGAKAWILEAEALALSGRLPEAISSVEALLAEARIPEAGKDRPRALRRFFGQVVKPTLDWFESAEAQKIRRKAGERGLRNAVAEQFEPLIGWWEEWKGSAGASGPESELLDFWGRGGFSRIAAAVRAKPHAAIAVDASNVEHVRKWTRILCPLFDTVIVKWKGTLGSGLVITPIHEEYGEREDDFGGHGYMIAAGSAFESHGGKWHPAMSWANPVAHDLSRFLAGEALPLLRSGRLVVLPAPLVGCTQTAVGWTDNLLVESFLGGVVNAARRQEAHAPRNGHERVLDIASIQIPFVDNVALADLAAVLDETERWIAPLRGLLFKAMANEDLNYERWDRVAALEYDIQQACRELREHLCSLVAKHPEGGWKVGESGGGISAGERGTTPLPRESLTNLLQTVSSIRRDLSPWIPYLRLQDHGGHLHWTCPLDNPSTPPDEEAKARLAATGQGGRDMHTWICPGTPGWVIPTAFRVP